MKVTCDKCKSEFFNLLKEEQKKIDGKEITCTFIQCPNCGEKYIVCYDDVSTVVLKKQIRKHVEMLKTIKDSKQYESKLKNIKKKQKRLERETKLLEKKYHKYFEN